MSEKQERILESYWWHVNQINESICEAKVMIFIPVALLIGLYIAKNHYRAMLREILDIREEQEQ